MEYPKHNSGIPLANSMPIEYGSSMGKAKEERRTIHWHYQ